uniref:Uncharacterized protein n=1 Tax=Anguilla anguilla TaxID=7936 RepID=A0A0E9RRC3_ANGAN
MCQADKSPRNKYNDHLNCLWCISILYNSSLFQDLFLFIFFLLLSLFLHL